MFQNIQIEYKGFIQNTVLHVVQRLMNLTLPLIILDFKASALICFVVLTGNPKYLAEGS